MGEVNTPGAVPLKGSMTVLQALAVAGGFKDFANKGGIKVLRKTPGSDRVETIPFSYKDAVRSDAAVVLPGRRRHGGGAVIDRRRRAPCRPRALILTLTRRRGTAQLGASVTRARRAGPSARLVGDAGDGRLARCGTTTRRSRPKATSRSGDFVTAVRPSLALGYRGRRTTLRSDYAGTFDFYRELSEREPPRPPRRPRLHASG